MRSARTSQSAMSFGILLFRLKGIDLLQNPFYFIIGSTGLKSYIRTLNAKQTNFFQGTFFQLVDRKREKI